MKEVRAMKSGKDEGKAMDPLFPRLHINDADKGGPRAPPRNKMALYNMSSKCKPGVVPVPTFTPCNSFLSQGSLSNNCSTNEKHLSQCNGISRFSQPKVEYGIGVSNICMANAEALVVKSGDENKLMAKTQPELFLNRSFSSSDDPSQQKPGDGKLDVALPSFLRFPKTVGYGSITGKGELSLLVSSDAQEKRNTSLDAIPSIHETVLRKRKTYATEDPSCCSSSDHDAADDIVRIIGRKLFWDARNTIIQQQKIFSAQIFELHRLLKVQKLISKLPHNNFDISVMKKSHLRASDSGPKAEGEKSHVSITEPTVLLSKQLSSDCSSIVASKLAPWYQPGQWLVPVRSPSEGLIYKPFSLPCFPALGLTNPPLYGSHGIGQSYLFGQNAEVEQMSPVSETQMEVEKASSMSQQAVPLQGDALSLFPTTPSPQPYDYNKFKVQVIKVVPYNRKMASESAKRILQIIQEERTRNSQQLS